MPYFVSVQNDGTIQLYSNVKYWAVKSEDLRITAFSHIGMK
jgi:hypothetical protein